MYNVSVKVKRRKSIEAGKSPHSGFTPDCPKAFDGFAKPSRPSRFEESNNQ